MASQTVSPRSLPLISIDAFTSVPFSGNPAAICLVKSDQNVSDQQMQKIASEINLSETAFIRALTKESAFDKEDKFGLRWFTPTNEVPLCGHATLASAAVLFKCVGNDSSRLHFETLSGTLIARREGEDIVLDLPLNAPVPDESPELQDLIKAVVRDLDVSEVYYSPTTKKLLIRVADKYSRKDVESLSPNPAQLMERHNGDKVKGVIVTLKGTAANGCVDRNGETYDFVSRYFAPWNGIPEDPVTGSAHTVLVPYWAEKLGKSQFYACQCSSRCGELRCKVRDDGRVDVAGKSAVVIQGIINI